jgi:hypothetical protein
MKKIIFWGDGILAGPSGFAELLSNHIFLHHPRADVKVYPYGGETESWPDVVRDTPLHVIGKAPDLVILGFGYSDLAAGRSNADIVQMASGVITLILQKTQARICLLSTVSSFMDEESERDRCRVLNRTMRGLTDDSRVRWVDLESRVDWFHSEHLQAPGDEKHSLHLIRNRLTPLGRLYLAHHAFHLIHWPDGLAGAPGSDQPVPF